MKRRALSESEREEIAELRALFEMQRRRMGEATERWRAEDPAARALISPDLGDLLKWLMAKGDAAAPALSPIESLPPGPFEYATSAAPGEHHGTGHVYITDATGKKLASIWGPADVKMAIVDFIISARARLP